MKFLKGLGVFILTIVLFLSTLGLLILIPIKSTISKDTIKNTITNLDIAKMIKESPEIESAINEMFEPLYEQARDFGIDEDVVVKIIDSKEVKGLVGGIAGNLVDYVVTGENQKIVSTNDISTLVGSVLDDIDESGFYKFKDDEKSKILGAVEEQVNNYQDLLPDTSIIEDTLDKDSDAKEIKEGLELIRFILGNNLIIYLVVAMLVSILGILGLKFKKAKWIKTVAITILVSSIFALIATFGLKFVGDILVEEVKEVPFLNVLINKPINFSFILSGTITLLMIVTLIVYTVLKNKKPEVKEV